MTIVRYPYEYLMTDYIFESRMDLDIYWYSERRLCQFIANLSNCTECSASLNSDSGLPLFVWHVLDSISCDACLQTILPSPGL